MTFTDSFGIERELAPGERLLWKGRPHTGIKFRSQDAYGIPFGLFWCAFIIFWGYGFFSKTHAGNDFNFFVVGTLILFGLIGFHMMVGRFLADAYTRSKMEYALTDRRAMIVSNTFTRKVRSIDYRTEPNISLAERSDGSGTIYFGEQTQSYGRYYNNYQMLSSGSVSGFEFIDNARDVYQRILQAKES